MINFNCCDKIILGCGYMNNDGKMYCTRCGAEMNSNSRYCMKCGNLNPDHEANQNMSPYIQSNQSSYNIGQGVIVF